jgi:hypothetical protein
MGYDNPVRAALRLYAIDAGNHLAFGSPDFLATQMAEVALGALAEVARMKGNMSAQRLIRDVLLDMNSDDTQHKE